jgi:hypothetical protein
MLMPAGGLFRAWRCSCFLLYLCNHQNFPQMLTEKDLGQIRKKGISANLIEKQLSYFREGIPPVKLDRPAIPGDGIIQPEEAGVERLAAEYDRALSNLNMAKFVPASGAATRMFRDLFAWREALAGGTGLRELLGKDDAAAMFFGRLRDFAFWDDLSMAMFREDLDAEHLLGDRNFLPLLDFILFDYGLDYGSLPKGLLAFHRYGDHCRTPFEEHLVEAALYCSGGDGKARVHFTVSPDHLEKFKLLLGQVNDRYSREFQVDFEVGFSLQKPSTDTIAADLENQPFRELGGSLLFRPGGHGALIENLNDLEADFVFIKNIDNVVPDHLKERTILFKKALGGMLAGLRGKVNQWLKRLEQGKLSREEYLSAVGFCCDELSMDPQVFPAVPEEGIPVLKQMLDRPIRVCGMVKNQGEPGGGPFWVTDPGSGHRSLQIVESSQIDLGDPVQESIFRKSTHFNPVDLVCSIRDYRGRPFDLRKFVDPAAGFISEKSKDGRKLKALELPGLWNGAMADWISLFVEVPLITFNPVKVVNDLLRKEHQ